MSTFQWIAIAAVTIVSSARLTRLGTYDRFPPIKWVRDAFEDWSDKTERRRKWQEVAFCAYCFSIYPTIAVVLSGYYSNWHEAWWLVNGALGGSYLAAILMIHDGEPADDEDDN